MEKNMKDEDYDKYEQNLMEAIFKFNTLFADYVKSVDEDLWKRAVDYAKDYSGSGNVSFDYVSEKTPDNLLKNTLSQTIFLRDLATDIEEVREEYIAFIRNNKSKTTKEMQEKWLQYYQTTPEDPFGYQQDINMFIECDHKFNFSEFDDEDWLNYTNITIHCTTNRNFQDKFMDILNEHDSDGHMIKYFTTAIKSIDKMIGDLPEYDENDEDESEQ
jgi:hypothetical protein